MNTILFSVFNHNQMHKNHALFSGYNRLIVFTFLIFVQIILPRVRAFGQSELMAWGNLNGIRIDGQLMEFESSLRVVQSDWQHYQMTAMERQRPKYHREGNQQTVTTAINPVQFIEVVKDTGQGIVTMHIKATAEKDTILEGVFLCFDLPGKYYKNGTITFTAGKPSGKSTLNVKDIQAASNKHPFKIQAKGISIKSPERQLEIDFGNQTNLFLRREQPDDSNLQVYVEIMEGNIKKGQLSDKELTIKASGKLDTRPASIVLDVKNPGRKFDGLGGNFRLQNPKTDPPVIQYCLDNLRVAWGRVEMPWKFWQPDENTDPIEIANAGKLNPHVKAAMEMAQRLAKKGIPVIVTDWSAPAWAIIGDPMDAYRYRSKGIYGYPLNPKKMNKIYKSIGDYLVYLKQYYGVEAAMFSFNESDLGIDVRMTGQQQDELIKGLGAYLASRGLSTKLLLGDNSDATTFDFILPAMNDPETYPYIGAISFHSWRGCMPENLEKWAGAAKKLNLPLLVGEGSTDAAAWNYPDIFLEPSFALNEINLYLRLCSTCQPRSILQWQLTADYSVMTGDGIFGTKGPLHPTQRFWNLKQLASTPADAFSIPLTCDKDEINCAAFGNFARGEFAVHLVNNGASCETTISGFPDTVNTLNMYVTNSKSNMKEAGVIEVKKGKAQLKLPPASFVTLLTNK